MLTMPRRGRRRRTNNPRLLCFSNFMQPFTPESPPMSPTATSSSLLLQHNHNRSSPTNATTSSIMIKNFNTLYDHTITLRYPFLLPTTTFEPEPEPEPKPADFATAFASQRFFFSSPGRSNSIVESTNTNTSSSSSSSSPLLMTTVPPPAGVSTAACDGDNNNNKKKVLFNGSVAVPTYSPDPYLDFRRSMQEMVEARPELMDVKSNWDVLHELLHCYLSLNPNNTHKFILGAFSDLLVSLMSLSSSSSSTPPPLPQNLNPSDIDAGGRGCYNLDNC